MGDFREAVLPTLTSNQQALDTGYAEGTLLRKLGGQRERLNEQREILECGHPDERGERNVFHNAWGLGFNAGYLGEPKPALCL